MKEKGFTHLLLIIAFILLAIMAVVFLKVGGFEIKPRTFPSPSPTTKWETYGNSEVGFSFQHPASWSREEIDDEYFGYYGTEGSVYVSWGKGLTGAEGGSCDPNMSWFTVTPYSVKENNLEGCVSTISGQTYIVSKKLNNDITILIMAGDSDFATNYQEEIIKQILSTFEFTEE